MFARHTARVIKSSRVLTEAARVATTATGSYTTNGLNYLPLGIVEAVPWIQHQQHKSFSTSLVAQATRTVSSVPLQSPLSVQDLVDVIEHLVVSPQGPKFKVLPFHDVVTAPRAVLMPSTRGVPLTYQPDEQYFDDVFKNLVLKNINASASQGSRDFIDKASSKVGLLYGSPGTGKTSTLIHSPEQIRNRLARNLGISNAKDAMRLPVVALTCYFGNGNGIKSEEQDVLATKLSKKYGRDIVDVGPSAALRMIVSRLTTAQGNVVNPAAGFSHIFALLGKKKFQALTVEHVKRLFNALYFELGDVKVSQELYKQCRSDGVEPLLEQPGVDVGNAAAAAHRFIPPLYLSLTDEYQDIDEEMLHSFVNAITDGTRTVSDANFVQLMAGLVLVDLWRASLGSDMEIFVPKSSPLLSMAQVRGILSNLEQDPRSKNRFKKWQNNRSFIRLMNYIGGFGRLLEIAVNAIIDNENWTGSDEDYAQITHTLREYLMGKNNSAQLKPGELNLDMRKAILRQVFFKDISDVPNDFNQKVVAAALALRTDKIASDLTLTPLMLEMHLQYFKENDDTTALFKALLAASIENLPKANENDTAALAAEWEEFGELMLNFRLAMARLLYGDSITVHKLFARANTEFLSDTLKYTEIMLPKRVGLRRKLTERLDGRLPPDSINAALNEAKNQFVRNVYAAAAAGDSMGLFHVYLSTSGELLLLQLQPKYRDNKSSGTITPKEIDEEIDKAEALFSAAKKANEDKCVLNIVDNILILFTNAEVSILSRHQGKVIVISKKEHQFFDFLRSSVMYHTISRRLFINSATEHDLSQVSGVGPVFSKLIFEVRQATGNFKDVDDLTARLCASGKRSQNVAKVVNKLLESDVQFVA